MNNRRSAWGNYAWKFIAPGFYEDMTTGKVLVVIGPREVYTGKVRLRSRRQLGGFYKSYVYRCGKRVIEKYIGVEYSEIKRG